MMLRFPALIGLALAASSALWSTPSFAQEGYPARTIKFVVPSLPGSTAHLSAAQLEVQAGITMVHVPYRGAQPALTDVVAGHVDMFFDTLATSVPLHRDGKVKLLAVADLQRAATAPDIPTFSEAGLPGFKSVTWFGLVAPPATPADLAEKINRDAVEILNTREVADMLRKISLEPGATSTAETGRFFAEETALW